MKESSIAPPAPPPDRHIREGETPKRTKYRLIKEVLYGEVALFRIEKRTWWGCKCVYPKGRDALLGGDHDEGRARRQFDIMSGRIKGNVTIIDEA